MSTGNLAWPLRHFAAQLEELRSGEVADMDQVGRILVELAADEEFFGPLIAQIPVAAPGDRWLIRPERGPRLVLVHRPEGVMGYTHSHRCWVGIAPSAGWRPISGGTRCAIRTDSPSCAWWTSASCIAVMWRRWSRPGTCTIMVMSRAPARVPTHSSSSAMTCSCSTGRNTTRSRGRGARSHPVIQAGRTGDLLLTDPARPWDQSLNARLRRRPGKPRPGRRRFGSAY